MGLRLPALFAGTVGLGGCLTGTTSVGQLPGSGTGGGDGTTTGSPVDAGASGPECDDPIPAFPGAEGFGTLTPGGRGGEVHVVTSLADEGPGTLRAALEATGPRVVVFRTGGTITLKSSILITEPYVTVLGQTAPGDGIELRADPGAFEETALGIATHDVVVRFLWIRPGPSGEPGCCRQAVSIGGGAHDVVIDHLSLGWTSDELLSSWYDAHNVTIQWSLFHHALVNSSHIDGPNGRAIALGADIRDHSFHHNLLVHNHLSNPEIASTWVTTFDVVNNVIYDHGGLAAGAHGNARVNLVGNTFLPGPSSVTTRRGLIVRDDARVHARDNRSPHRPDDSIDDWEVVGDGDAYDEVAPASARADAPFTAPAIEAAPVDLAREAVLDGAGATVPARDAIDVQLVQDVRRGTGTLIDAPAELGGWLDRAAGSPPADTDLDGLPDTWESSHGLDPMDPSDSSAIDPESCYTWVEVYGAELVL